MRVNIFRCPERSDRQPRASNGAPAQSTTGAQKMSCTHRATSPSIHDDASASIPPIASTNTGKVSPAPSNVRRVMSCSSESSSAPPNAGFRSKAIPHRGHVPGASASTPTHIGQKYFAPADGVAAPPSSACPPAPHACFSPTGAHRIGLDFSTAPQHGAAGELGVWSSMDPHHTGASPCGQAHSRRRPARPANREFLGLRFSLRSLLCRPPRRTPAPENAKLTWRNGRRVRLRTVWGNPWRFDSSREQLCGCKAHPQSTFSSACVRSAMRSVTSSRPTLKRMKPSPMSSG